LAYGIQIGYQSFYDLLKKDQERANTMTIDIGLMRNQLLGWIEGNAFTRYNFQHQRVTVGAQIEVTLYKNFFYKNTELYVGCEISHGKRYNSNSLFSDGKYINPIIFEMGVKNFFQ